MVKYKLRRKRKINGASIALKSPLLYDLFDVSSEELIHAKIKDLSSQMH